MATLLTFHTQASENIRFMSVGKEKKLGHFQQHCEDSPSAFYVCLSVCLYASKSFWFVHLLPCMPISFFLYMSIVSWHLYFTSIKSVLTSTCSLSWPGVITMHLLFDPVVSLFLKEPWNYSRNARMNTAGQASVYRGYGWIGFQDCDLQCVCVCECVCKKAGS